MTYTELIKCDKTKISELHERCVKMLAAKYYIVVNWKLKSATHEAKAWDLYRLNRGITYHNYNRAETEFTWNKLQFNFESLEELDLKLSAIGV